MFDPTSRTPSRMHSTLVRATITLHAAWRDVDHRGVARLPPRVDRVPGSRRLPRTGSAPTSPGCARGGRASSAAAATARSTGQASTGCCNHGAYFSDKDDEKRMRKFAEQLTPDDWQFYDEGHDKNGKLRLRREGRGRRREAPQDPHGRRRLHLRQPRGPSRRRSAARCTGWRCASGLNPLETKPEVCWQLPVRREQEWVDRPTAPASCASTVAEFDRRGWGEGGHDLDWYCTSSPEAHVGGEPMYVSYGAELIALIGAAGLRRARPSLRRPAQARPGRRPPRDRSG